MRSRTLQVQNDPSLQHFTQPVLFSAGSHLRAVNEPHANGALEGKGIWTNDDSERLSDHRPVSADQGLQRIFQSFPESPYLENRILTGLAHQGARRATHRPIRKSWVFMPVFASLSSLYFFGESGRDCSRPGWIEKWQCFRGRPALQIDSTDRNQLLAWSAARLESSSTFPVDLRKVEIRGAAVVTIAAHKAVFLKMKNEQRASFLIVDAR
jgi:hypothetical protein